MSSRVVDRVDGAIEPNGSGPGAPPPAPPRPFLPVALALVAVVVVVLAGAFLLERQLRRPVGVEPAPPVAAKEQPTAVARVAPTIAVPTAVPTAAAAPTATPVPTLAAVPTFAPAVAGASVPSQGAASPTVPRAADLLTPLHREIIDAYFRYWDVRGRAYYSLDTSQLKDVMAGDELAREEQGVRELAAQGRAARFDIEHNFRIVSVTADEALINDEYVNRSLFLDAATKREMPTKQTPPVEKVSFEMKRINGVWKVVDGAFHG